MMTPMPDRRRYPRYAVRMPFRLTRVNKQPESGIKLLLSEDISKAGLCFSFDRQIEIGHSIEVEVTLPGHGPAGNDLLISGTGRIVRAEKSDKPGHYNLAAEFIEPAHGEEPGWQELATAFDEPTKSPEDS